MQVRTYSYFHLRRHIFTRYSRTMWYNKRSSILTYAKYSRSIVYFYNFKLSLADKKKLVEGRRLITTSSFIPFIMVIYVVMTTRLVARPEVMHLTIDRRLKNFVTSQRSSARIPDTKWLEVQTQWPFALTLARTHTYIVRSQHTECIVHVF